MVTTPEINYPTTWHYKVILKHDTEPEKLFQSLIKQKFDFKPSNSSKNNKYKSYLVSVYVKNEKTRLELFEKLKANSMFVL